MLPRRRTRTRNLLRKLYRREVIKWKAAIQTRKTKCLIRGKTNDTNKTKNFLRRKTTRIADPAQRKKIKKRKCIYLSSKENGTHRSKSSREDLAKQEKKNKPEVATADVKSPDISDALNATPRVLLKLNKMKSTTTVPVDSDILVQKEASLKLKLSREKYLKAKEREGKEDVAPERLDQKVVPEPFSGDKEKQPLKELNQTVDTPNKKVLASSSVDVPVVPLGAEKKRKQDGQQAGTPDSSKKKRKSENEEKMIVQPVRQVVDFIFPGWIVLLMWWGVEDWDGLGIWSVRVWMIGCLLADSWWWRGREVGAGVGRHGNSVLGNYLVCILSGLFLGICGGTWFGANV